MCDYLLSEKTFYHRYLSVNTYLGICCIYEWFRRLSCEAKTAPFYFLNIKTEV